MLAHRSDTTVSRLFPARRRGAAVGLLLWCAALSQVACTSTGGNRFGVTDIVRPYQIDIQQGNVVTREQLEALRTGMPRTQVREVLGSPLLTSVFHADRWDYAFTFKRQGLPMQTRKLTLFFKGDVVDRIEADALPTEAEFVSSLDVRGGTDKAPALQATDEQLKNFQARNASTVVPTPTVAPTGTAPVAYPPLETTGATR